MEQQSALVLMQPLEDRRLLSIGHLDPTFGHLGQVSTDVANDDSAGRVLVQGDGKIVVLGSSLPNPEPNEYDDLEYALSAVRYNPDGSLDASFGEDGRTVIQRNPEGYGEFLRDGAIGRDGRAAV